MISETWVGCFEVLSADVYHVISTILIIHQQLHVKGGKKDIWKFCCLWLSCVISTLFFRNFSISCVTSPSSYLRFSWISRLGMMTLFPQLFLACLRRKICFNSNLFPLKMSLAWSVLERSRISNTLASKNKCTRLGEGPTVLQHVGF